MMPVQIIYSGEEQGLMRQIGFFRTASSFSLECEETLEHIELAFETYGQLNSAGDNAILLCHTLTGSAYAAGASAPMETFNKHVPFLRNKNFLWRPWWNELIGKGKTLDTDRYFIISSNILGSCYGSSGPASISPKTNQPYGVTFPPVTVRDMVRAQFELVKALGVQRLATVIGGSLGGMQVLEWAVMYPELVASIVPIATLAQHSAWAIGLNQIARVAIMSDPQWGNGNYRRQPVNGLAIARKVAMLSYRTDTSFNQRFGYERIYRHETIFSKKNLFQVENYLNYQGQKLVDRFDANSYIYLTYAMDYHDLSRGRAALKDVLGSIKARTLCVGIDSDLLYPDSEQREIAAAIPNAEYRQIKSNAGHDAFLIEYDQLDQIIRPFLQGVL